MAEAEIHDEFFSAALAEFSGLARLAAEDPRWSHLFRSAAVLRTLDGDEEHILRSMTRLVQHNPDTGNVLVLLEHTISRMRQLRGLTKQPAATTVAQCCVALRLTRFVCGFMCAHLPDAEVRRQLGLYSTWPLGSQSGVMSGGKGALAEGDVVVAGLMKELVHLCATNPADLHEWMPDVLFEAINLLITLFSTQLYNPFPSSLDGSAQLLNPFLEFVFLEASQQHNAMLTSHRVRSDSSVTIANQLVQALLEHITRPMNIRDLSSDSFSRIARVLADRAREEQHRERAEVTPSQPVANIAAALPSLAEWKAMSETIWEGLTNFGSAATSILSLPFSWTRMYSLIFNAAARARGHLSGTMITHPANSAATAPRVQPADQPLPEAGQPMLAASVKSFEKDPLAGVSLHPLPQRCVLLLLILVHNHRGSGTALNPFRAAFCTLADASAQSDATAESIMAIYEDALSSVSRVRIPFGELITSVSNEVPLESSSLLLYTLLQSNPELMYSTLGRIGPETMMASVLHGLYQPMACNGPKHLYTLVITLLMCTQDEAFVANSFRTLKLQVVPWYKERLLRNVAIGSLSILCLLRTLVFALLSVRDEYLLANVLAALSNLSSQIENIHPYTAQRVVTVCIKLARRLASMSNSAVQGASLATIVRAQEPDAPASLKTPPSSRSTVDDAQACSQALQTLLLLVWQALRPAGRSGNVHMLYSLVHQAQEVSVLLGHPSVVELCPDAAMIVQFTHHYYKLLREEEGDISTSEQAISGLLRAVHANDQIQLDAREVMTFSYEEGEQPESFFVPYVWEVTTNATPDLGWHSARICIFDAALLSPVSAQGLQERLGEDVAAAVVSLEEHV